MRLLAALLIWAGLATAAAAQTQPDPGLIGPGLPINSSYLRQMFGSKTDTQNGRLTGGIIDATTTLAGTSAGSVVSQAAASLPAVQNPSFAVVNLTSPKVDCAGNAGPNWTSGGAYGSLCMAMMPPSDTFGYQQTYLGQFDLMVPDMPSPEKNYAARDQVALYAETRMGSYGPAGWAFNFLAQANTNASTTLGGEIDLNNLSGCDSAGVDGTYTGGSAAVVATRSDGSGCPSKIGLLITGVAQHTSTAGLQFQYVSDGSHDMWQDGIRMLGGNMASEYDWISNTASISAFKIDGAHAQHGVDLIDGNFSGGAIGLKSTDGASGKIGWYCSMSGCVSGWPTSAGISPANDGKMHLTGTSWSADNLFAMPNGAQASNYILSSGGNYIFNQANGTAAITMGYDAANVQVHVASGGISADGMMSASTGAFTTLSFDPSGNGPASSSAACTKGQAAWATGFFYICVAANTWQRAALSAF